MPTRPTLTAGQQEALRAWFREHWQNGVHFNEHIGVRITQWDGAGAVFQLAYRDELSAHEDMFHGGVIAALIDTSGCGAVMAGHDYERGSRCSTVSLNVNYLAPAAAEGLVAEAVCTRRGRAVNHAEVRVFGAKSRIFIAHGLVVVHVSGTRAGINRVLGEAG